MFFFHEYYGLVINVREIASHKLVLVAQDIRGMETTFLLSYATLMAGHKIMLVCYQLTKSKMTMTRTAKYELRVQIYELRFQIYKLRVQFHELRIQIHELQVQIH